MSKLLIIDTFGLIFRAYHAYPILTTTDGKPTNAIYGFILMLLQTIERIAPDYIVCSLESETPTFRHELAQDYKANRKEMEPELKDQIGDIIDVINTLGIKILQKNGYEADDVIGSFATQNQDFFDEIVIVTGDRDLYQLISDKIKVLTPGKSFADLIEYDRTRFEEKYNIKLEDFVLYKSIIGDSSDNIKGIPGIGPKGAEKIVNQYHSIDSILANLDQLPPRVADAITQCQEFWKDYYTLCKIETGIKLEINPEDTKVSKIQSHKLRRLADQYEFKSMQKRIARFIDTFEKKYGSFGLFDDAFGETVSKHELRYSLVDSVQFNEIIENAEILPVKEAYVLNTPSGYRIGNGEFFIEVTGNDLYKMIVTHGIKQFIGFDLKPFIKDLLDAGIEQLEKLTFFDLKLAWYLIQSDREYESIHDLVENLEVDVYSLLYTKTTERLNTDSLIPLFTVEQTLQKVLAVMEYTGIFCDLAYLKELESEYKKNIQTLKQEMFDHVGFEFNPASTKDLGHVLFEVLKLPVQKKNKTGYSTDDSTLTKLEGMNEIIPMIKNFRMYSKALSTYIIGLQPFIDSQGKIHTTFNQAQVATGRLSSINPNLQNLPTNESVGMPIKRAFKARPGYYFLSFDYSQIDLRVLAYETGDEALQQAFINDEDIHTATAKLIFEKDDIAKEERSFAKTINFGIVYGMEPYGLSQALKIDQASAKAFIDKYFEKFPGVKKYFGRITKQLDEKGYVNTFLGRKRYFPSWNKFSGYQKRMLFREAINMPIQGGTSEIIKIAMNGIYSYIRKNNLDCSMLLQIHDELIFEIHESIDIEKLSSDIRDIMIKAYDIKIPLKVSSKTGKDLTFLQ